VRRLLGLAAVVGLALIPSAASAPADYPEDAQFVPIAAGAYQAADRPGGGLFVDYVIIHDTEGSYPTTLAIFTSPTSCCSVHYLVDGQAGAHYPSVSQFVHDKDIAYHAGNFWFNQHSVGIEHDGFADGPIGFYTASMYQASAHLAGWIAAQHGIPIDRAHFLSHANLPGPGQAYTNGMHWDPGPFWDWPYYFKLIRREYKVWAKKKTLPVPAVPKRFRRTRSEIRTIDIGKQFAGRPDVTAWSSGAHTEFANVFSDPPDSLVLGASDPSTWTSPTTYDQRDFSCDNLPNVTSAMGMDQNSDQRAKADWGEAFVRIGSKEVGGVRYDEIWFNGTHGWVRHADTRSGWGVVVRFKGPTPIGPASRLYGKPILDPANEICPDQSYAFARAGQSYVAQNVYTDQAAGITWYEIYYNHRVAWVPASEVTIR
jgi:N-acetyl-anhydromuramyl-L-alanine amidase AmpD